MLHSSVGWFTGTDVLRESGKSGSCMAKRDVVDIKIGVEGTNFSGKTLTILHQRMGITIKMRCWDSTWSFNDESIWRKKN